MKQCKAKYPGTERYKDAEYNERKYYIFLSDKWFSDNHKDMISDKYTITFTVNYPFGNIKERSAKRTIVCSACDTYLISHNNDKTIKPKIAYKILSDTNEVGVDCSSFVGMYYLPERYAYGYWRNLVGYQKSKDYTVTRHITTEYINELENSIKI